MIFGLIYKNLKSPLVGQHGNFQKNENIFSIFLEEKTSYYAKRLRNHFLTNIFCLMVVSSFLLDWLNDDCKKNDRFYFL